MKSLKKTSIWVFFILAAIVQLFPLIWLVNYSFLDRNQFYSDDLIKWPTSPKWGNYVNAWVDGNFLKYLTNSIVVSGASILLTIVISVMLAFAFTRMKWKLRGLFFAIILLGIMIPVHATLLPDFVILKKLGLTDSYWALILPYTAVNVPIGMFMLSGFMRTIPGALEESAVIDGCGIYRLVFQIVLPIMKPAVVTVAITCFLFCWNEFILAATFLSRETYKTLPFAVQNFTGMYSSDYGSQFAVMVLISVPAIVIYALFNEQITKGITAGAVKG